MKNKLQNAAQKNTLILAGIGIFFAGLFVFTLCLESCSFDAKGASRIYYADEDISFIRVKGTKLYNPDNSIYKIKSMGLGNDAFGERSAIPYKHHSEASYKELSEMGFNTVRFYLTYKMFETNENPYVYNSEVFDWIDSNIDWAKKYNMHIILDMHTPQGGYQSEGKGLELFTNKSNQDRLIKLWGKIAEYYKDCPVILGYDLVNEPQVPFDTDLRNSVKAWTKLAQKCIDEIRKVDTNHIIFVERITGTRPWQTPVSVDPVYCYPEVIDDNFVFQAHFYDRFSFTHQGSDADNFKYKNVRENYPLIEISGEPIWRGEYTTSFTEVPDYLIPYWRRYSYDLFVWDSTIGNSARIAVKTGITGKEGSICIDDIQLLRIYPDGRGEEIYFYNFDTPDQFAAWNFGGEGNLQGTMTYAKEGSNGFIRVAGTQAHTWVTAPTDTLQPLEEGISYRMYVSIRFENMTYSTGAYGFDIEYLERSEVFNKESIRRIINDWNTYPAQQNKPLFIGEFGCFHICFDYNCGVEQYLKDCADVFNNYCCGYNYHVYHESNFGLHLSNPNTSVSKTDLNKGLYDLLCKINKL